MTYRGRFAPSPTGLLHAGSLVAALASWLDARAHDGTWLVRMEDTDAPRCSAAAGRGILEQLSRLGLMTDEPVVWQSTRGPAYQAALARLQHEGRTYRCRCSRRELDLWWAKHPDPVLFQTGERPYPGLCRTRAWPADGPGAIRLRTQNAAPVAWIDRRLGPQRQDLAQAVGDFVLLRADGLWAYQLAVVVDDADQGITHVVRGEDLADNTPRQILLQRRLGLAQPSYLHMPLVMAEDGRKLSKQNGARALELSDPVRALSEAATVLGLPEILCRADSSSHTQTDWLGAAVAAWPWRPASASVG